MRTTKLLPILLLLLSSTAAALPEDVRLSWTQADTSTTMTITWNSAQEGDPSVVLYGIDAVEENTVHGNVKSFDGTLGAIHEVDIDGLEPSTTYMYKVGGEGQWSSVYKFTTGPVDGCQPWSFAALGDNRPDADWLPPMRWSPILEETAGREPAFILHTGDIVKDGEDVNQWVDFLEHSDPVLAEIPMMASIGNHDNGPGQGDTAYYNRLFSFPTNTQNNTEDYFFIEYGNAIFVALSTQTFGGGETPMADQAAWLDQVLTDHPKKWKFVYLHHPPYTSHRSFNLIFTEFDFNHPSNEKGQNPALVPIFDKHHVDIVFAGHNHYYERIGPLRYGTQPDDGIEAADYSDGTLYIITGGGGALVYDEFNIPVLDFDIDLVDWVCGTATGSVMCKGDHHYVLINIQDGTLHYEVWATEQQTADNSPDNKKLIDSLIITKPDSPECQVVVEPSPELQPEPMPDVVTPDVVAEIVEVIPSQPDVPTELVPGDTEGKEGGNATEVQTSEDALPTADNTGSDALPTTEKKGNGGCSSSPDSSPMSPWQSGALLLIFLAGLALLSCRRKTLK